MVIIKGQTYKTPAGLILKVKTVRESGIHTLELIDEKGNVIPERRNSFGHVVERSERICTEETISSFKKVTLLILMFLSFTTYSQQKFVLAVNSKHKVEMIDELKTISFNGRIYEIKQGTRRGWIIKDSITWVYGHNPKKFKDMVKVGFYNNFKNYVVSTKTEKLKSLENGSN